MRQAESRQWLRSALVGLVATAIDLGALRLLVELCGASPSSANVPALLLGVGAQFVGNKLLAFRDRARGAALVSQGLRFVVVEAGALALNALLFQFLIAAAHAPYLAARLVASALVYAGYSYPLWGRIFRQEQAA